MHSMIRSKTKGHASILSETIHSHARTQAVYNRLEKRSKGLENMRDQDRKCPSDKQKYHKKLKTVVIRLIKGILAPLENAE